MTRDEIIAKLKETTPALRAEGVTRLAIFGSRARGDAGDDSDLDVLIDVDPQAGFEGLHPDRGQSFPLSLGSIDRNQC
jgi:predicted nucleotidyltransferase